MVWAGIALWAGASPALTPHVCKDGPRAGLVALRCAAARHGAAPVPAAGAPVDRDWGGGRPVFSRPTQRQPTPLLCPLASWTWKALPRPLPDPHTQGRSRAHERPHHCGGSSPGPQALPPLPSWGRLGATGKAHASSGRELGKDRRRGTLGALQLQHSIVVKAHSTGEAITASLPTCSERSRSAPEVTQHWCRLGAPKDTTGTSGPSSSVYCSPPQIPVVNFTI